MEIYLCRNREERYGPGEVIEAVVVASGPVIAVNTLIAWARDKNPRLPADMDFMASSIGRANAATQTGVLCVVEVPGR